VDENGGGEEQTYPQLLDEALRILGGLRKQGLDPGACVLFQLEKNAEFLAAFWACQLGGYVPVPVSISPTYEQHHNILSKLKNSWAMLGQPLTLCGAALAGRLEDFAQREGLTHFRTATLAQLRQDQPETSWHQPRPDDLALLLLTSGSTGLPKAVRQTHRTLLSWACSIKQHCRFTSADVSMNWMPLDHVGGLVMFHLRDVILGCRQIHAMTEPVLQRPLAWLEWIEKYRVTITWAPNFAFGLINEQETELAKKRYDLSSLAFVLNGGEAIVSRTARRFLSLLAPHGLPATAMRPAWGMSETCSSVTFSSRFTLATTSDDAAFVEVGEPIPGTQVRIVDGQDRPIAPGKIGRLQIKGVSITPGYHQNPEANKSSYTADGWFITGDLGILRDGQLSITGREKDVIIINGVNFYSQEIESAVEQVPGVEVSFTAACPIRLPELIKEIRSAVVSREAVNPDYVLPLAKDAIPKTAIGKIQRPQLKLQFERGEYEQLLAQTQASPEARAPDGPGSWFYRRVWRRTPAPTVSRPAASGPWLIIADAQGFGRTLAAEMKAQDQACVLVTPADCYARISADEFTVRSTATEDYLQLWTALESTGLRPMQVIELGDYGETTGFVSLEKFEKGQTARLSALISLNQVLARHHSEASPLHVWRVTTQAHAVQSSDVVAPARTSLAGWAKTLPQEIAGVTCTQIDLEPADVSRHASQIVAELGAPVEGAEIAYRQSQRFRAVLSKVSLSPEPAPALIKGGCYWLTGGVGGIGRAVARLLLEKHQARLLIVGRSPATAVEPKLAALRSLGGEILYVAADITDPVASAAALAGAERSWGRPLDGVFHLAGLFESRMFAEESPASLARALRPKISGAWVVHELVKARPGILVVNFSSLVGYFGGYCFGGYSISNAFLEGMSHHQRTLGLRSHCILWGTWSGTGMNSQFFADEGATRAKGYLPISQDEGIASLQAALASGHPDLLVGLNGGNINIRPHLDPDEAALMTDSTASNYVEPRTEIERQLVRIWQEVLKRPRVGIHDNFFEIGGRSLLAAKIFAQIEKIVGKSLPLVTLFRAPTIEKLAALLATDNAAADATVCQVQCLQKHGEQRPFFCIPGGASDVIAFRPLAASLGARQPFYGLQARGLDGTRSDTAIIHIVPLAREFIREIKAVQPEGPYRIGGHCFGALLAYEIARQLDAQGDTVEMLALFDPTAATTLRISALQAFIPRVRFLMKIYPRMSLREKVKFPFSFISHFFVGKAVINHRLQHTIERIRTLHEGYELLPYAGRTDVFLAEDSPHEYRGKNDCRLVLGNLSKNVRLHRVPGNHHTMLEDPCVSEMAKVLTRLMSDTKGEKTSSSVRQE
jgi:acyl-CoA synthetase (AMP-forming)/AMP-acid ligase II/thioesterase domain-containing protein/NAD(P)-dependent dehydrogenase (short-subunit alcohol dehydrogenase family)